MCSLVPRLSPLRSRESLGTSLHYVYKHSIKTNTGRDEEILKWGFQSYLCMHSLRQNLYFCNFAVFTKLSCCHSASAVLSSNLYIAIHVTKEWWHHLHHQPRSQATTLRNSNIEIVQVWRDLNCGYAYLKTQNRIKRKGSEQFATRTQLSGGTSNVERIVGWATHKTFPFGSKNCGPILITLMLLLIAQTWLIDIAVLNILCLACINFSIF